MMIKDVVSFVVMAAFVIAVSWIYAGIATPVPNSSCHGCESQV